MKDYVIDLGLEFGLRIRLAVAEAIQPEQKMNERERRGILVISRTPLLFPHLPATPPRRSLSPPLLSASSPSSSSPPPNLLH